VMQVDRGTIRVAGTDKDTIDVRVSRRVKHASGSDADRILAEENLVMAQKDNEISISAQEPPSLRSGGGWAWMRPDVGATYEVDVPRKFDLHLKTSAGDIRVASVQGGINARTDGGGLNFEGVEGDVEGQTQGGGIQATECNGALRVNTKGGGITLDGFAGPSVQATSAGGPITADFAASPKSDSSLHTGGGSVTVRIPATAMLTLDAHAGGGKVKTDLEVQAEGATGDGTLRGKINGGGPLLKLDTGGGYISVVKR